VVERVIERDATPVAGPAPPARLVDEPAPAGTPAPLVVTAEPTPGPAVAAAAPQPAAGLAPTAPPPPLVPVAVHTAPPAPLAPPAPTAEPARDAGGVTHVTIGRLEVRAALAPEPKPSARPAPKSSAMSLESYLESRHGARR
jgi:hypothetical protein